MIKSLPKVDFFRCFFSRHGFDDEDPHPWVTGANIDVCWKKEQKYRTLRILDPPMEGFEPV